MTKVVCVVVAITAVRKCNTDETCTGFHSALNNQMCTHCKAQPKPICPISKENTKQRIARSVLENKDNLTASYD